MSTPAIFDDEMKEIVESFIVETKELLDKLDNDLVELEKRQNDVELLNAIFRYVHTIKGTSSFIGFEQMSELTHKFEDVLNKLRKFELKLNPEIMDVILKAQDLMKVLLSKLEANDLSPIDISGVVSKLERISRGEFLIEEDVEKASVDNVSQKLQSKVIDKTVRIDVERLDELMNLVGELVLGRNRLTQIVSGIVERFEGESLARELMDTIAQVDYLTSELQAVVMRARMMPIAKVFSKFPRIVRDLSRDLNKEVELLIYGEETEVDKSVIESIHDPLVHLIRNAIDHGIETPQERKAVGKPEKGKVYFES
jgi:two-component system chemotaxis sensor kinase CheA